MPGESLLEAAGQNFRGAGETAIASRNADTSRMEAEQRPGMEATKEIGETLRLAMGEKAKMKEMQEQASLELKTELLKRKMNMVKFDPSIAITLSKITGDASYAQFSGMEMPAQMQTAIASKAIESSFKNKPMPVTLPDGRIAYGHPTKDADGNWSMKIIEGGTVPKKESRSGTSGKLPDPTKSPKAFVDAFNKMQTQLTSKERDLAYHPDDAAVKKEIEQIREEIEVNRGAYDEALKQLRTSGAGSPASAGGGGSDDPMKAIEDIWNKASAGQAPPAESGSLSGEGSGEANP